MKSIALLLIVPFMQAPAPQRPPTETVAVVGRGVAFKIQTQAEGVKGRAK